MLAGTTPVSPHADYEAAGDLVALDLYGDMNCDGVVNLADIDAFTLALSDPAGYHTAYPNCDIMNADCNGDGLVNFADVDAFTALLSSNNYALAFTLTWDGENRLATWYPTFPDANSRKVTFSYDYQGRRVEKKVYNWTGSQWQTTASLHRKFVWGGTGGSPASGWLLLMELDGLNGDAVLRKYTYGLDLGGVASGASAGRLGLEAAGTIGGVLATYDTNGTPGTTDDRTFVYCYDANGNVGQLIQTTAGGNYGTIAAKFEYDPYGARSNPPMIGEFAQPFRFSTKYFDAETGFLYFGGRYYQPSLGRWLNRDPIEEAGGPNLYAYAGNDPIDRFDPLGYVWCQHPENCGGGAGGGGVPDSGPWACVKGDDPSQSKPTTKPAGSQPTTKPATQPATQPNCRNCQECLQKALEDEKIKKLLSDLRQKGCDPNPRCGSPNEPPCNIPGAGGGYSVLGGTGITMCGTFSIDKLYHELIHAWQFCKQKGHPGGPPGPADLPPANIVACNEVEAYGCSGNCGPVDWQNEEFVKCVGNGCRNSLLAYCNQNPAACPDDKSTWDSWATNLCQRGINSKSCRRCDKIAGAQ